MTGFLVPLALVVGTTIACEIFATLAHRHIMHGFGWAWHRSHHEPQTGLFETNDLYALIIAVVSAALVVGGSLWSMPLMWVGIGLCVYGLLYFVMHDGLVHQRWPFRAVPRRGYLKRLYQAHKLHHAVESRDGSVSFGFLYAPPVARLRERLRRTHPGT